MAQGGKTKFTSTGLGALGKGQWSSDAGHVGAGQLQARGMGGGKCGFYFRYSVLIDAKQVQTRIAIGTFPTVSLSTARDEARELSRRYMAGERDLKEALEVDERERQRLTDATRAAHEARSGSTLGVLLMSYCDSLEAAGKVSHRLVRLALIRHVQKAWPALWATPAAEVSDDDIVAVVGRVADLKDKGGNLKLRTAAKLRSYLRAAYGAAIRARQSPQASQSLRALGIRHNPANDVAPIVGASKARNRALSVDELRAYWTRICAMQGDARTAGAALQLHLLTGCQRVVQLARATVVDLDVDTQTIRLLDGKGRRQQARPHFVPLTAPAQAALHVMRGDSPTGDFLFTLSRGLTAISYESLRDWVVIVREEMAEAGELPGGPFTVGDLRRTVETRLAGEKVSKDIRAQLQSHGLGGVQDRNYDRHDYLDEKIGALETLHRLLTGASAKVTPIRRKRSA